MFKAKNGWLLGLIIGAIAIFLLILPFAIYVNNNRDIFYVTGYLATREVYSIDENNIKTFLETEYPDAEENDFVRIIDTDTDWNYEMVDGELQWVDYEFQHPYMTANDFTMALIMVLIIIGLVLLKALKTIDKAISTPIWLVLFGFLLLFLKGILVYLPNLMFCGAIGWVGFYILIKVAKRQFDKSREYRNERIRVDARNEAQ